MDTVSKEILSDQEWLQSCKRVKNLRLAVLKYSCNKTQVHLGTLENLKNCYVKNTVLSKFSCHCQIVKRREKIIRWEKVMQE